MRVLISWSHSCWDTRKRSVATTPRGAASANSAATASLPLRTCAVITTPASTGTRASATRAPRAVDVNLRRHRPTAATAAAGPMSGLRNRAPHSRPPASEYWVANTKAVNTTAITPKGTAAPKIGGAHTKGGNTAGHPPKRTGRRAARGKAAPPHPREGPRHKHPPQLNVGAPPAPPQHHDRGQHQEHR